jgi:hypothetical protein
MSRKVPIPPEHKEIAKGSGGAAVLMFMHIAVVGYLAFILVYLVRHFDWQLLGSFVALKAALIYWLPAGFAVMTFWPTDPLTRTVGRVAYWLGWVMLGFYAAALCGIVLNPRGAEGGGAVISAIAAAVVGLGLGYVMRRVFGALTKAARENYKKNARENEVAE